MLGVKKNFFKEYFVRFEDSENVTGHRNSLRLEA
jgi:hypothetical protein